MAFIEEQNQKLEETIQYAEITSKRLNQSMNYAKNIQDILLPQTAEIQSFFKEHFIIYRPKDIVSGDFYWFLPLSKEVSVFVLADCTGHGVVGAFMSMITSTLLHEIVSVRGLENPAKILANLNQSINIILKQKTSGNTDGVDMQICFFEKRKEEIALTYASSKSFFFYWTGGELHYVKGDKIAIGGISSRQVEFETYQFVLPIDATFYFATDGFIDQNDATRARFGRNNLMLLLAKVADLPLEEQQKQIELALNKFQGREPQRDDISLIGLRC
jgi:serine phosphatase RsbU (regulator of sigma subunit)